ncbi:Dehydration-responsive element-binding protein 3 [Morella rubra]|uniref:Dehydration-responsive element-binding protein 3 n=1 Tax=Morella rubra TaxID=262757 RepID=A0A6A1VH65_9ROSI|nr:Dehydration-responsive element-binding protein 3 [Morella rubra]
MAARAHDVAALSIKGSSAILNFPELAHSLPRPVSLAPRDVQAAATKAAQMDKFNSASSSLSSLVSAMDLSEKLSEIVELPSLGTSYL